MVRIFKHVEVQNINLICTSNLIKNINFINVSRLTRRYSHFCLTYLRAGIVITNVSCSIQLEME